MVIIMNMTSTAAADDDDHNNIHFLKDYKEEFVTTS